MTKLLKSILDKISENIPTQVSLNLPKLKKVSSDTPKTNLPEVKLPKLKKVTSEVGV